jgi:3,4-dihydroxy-2-butanone 4-phosphate synthase
MTRSRERTGKEQNTEDLAVILLLRFSIVIGITRNNKKDKVPSWASHGQLEKIHTTHPSFFVVNSGYVCVPTAPSRLEELNLPLMVPNNQELMKTAYTISVDYAHGTTTGISAHDRALTARSLADPTKTAKDFNRPGHILPLRYTKGGVLRRTGHTEAR